MKKEFIMPSLEMKKFNRNVLTDVSDAPPQNFDEAMDSIKTKVNVEEVAVINLTI